MRLTSLVPLLLLAPVFAQEPVWLTSFEAAKAAAAKEQKPILAAFVGSDWCGYSIKLKDEVFRTPEFAKLAATVVLLEVDFPKQKQLSPELVEQNRQLSKQFGINRQAATLVLDATGKQLGAPVDYTRGGAAGWIEAIQQRIAAGAKAASRRAAGPAVVSWTTDYDAALAKAKAEKKVVLADFTGSDWCGWCIKLKEEVFEQPEFLEWAKDNVVLLELDFPRKKKLDDSLAKQNGKLAADLGIDGYPTIVFLDAQGKAIGRTGYVAGGPAAWIAAAEKEAGLGSKNKGKKRA